MTYYQDMQELMLANTYFQELLAVVSASLLSLVITKK